MSFSNHKQTNKQTEQKALIPAPILTSEWVRQ